MKAIDRYSALFFGAYQAIHVAVNGRYMFGDGLNAFPEPPGGWQDQTIEWARGMAITDWIVAVASVVFVIAFLRNQRWSVPLGTATTSCYVFATVAFTISISTTDAWGEGAAFYTFIVVTALPGFVLWGRLLVLSAAGSRTG